MSTRPEREPSFSYSVDEAANALRVSPRMVRMLITRRELRSFRIGRRVLVSVEALAVFVRDRQAEEAK